MNKRAFTLAELIAVITIIGILSGIAVVSVTLLMNNFKLEYYKGLEKSVTAAAKEYVSDHRNLVYNGANETTFSVQTLIDNAYISSVKVYNKRDETNPDEYKNCTGSIIYNKSNKTYRVCLVCDGENHGSCS